MDWDNVIAFTRLVESILKGVANDAADPVWLKDDFFGRIYDGPMQK